jgi:preprotein translocase subunit SecA
VVEPGDFTVDEKSHQVFLTEAGHEKAEAILTEAGLLAEGASLYDPANIALMHHVYAALRAHHLYHRDQHYVVQNGEVIIVDEFTGRLMTGRRWSDGLHQAVEAKEGVQIQSENQTLASVTFQNYFRMYGKLAGMTGTADTEAYEFQEIYGLETVVIPPNKPTVRKDDNDLIYKTAREKYDAVVKDIRDCYERGQPVLVGTTSIENSELVSGLLTQAKLPHQVLNAKQHAKEAEIVAQAGRPKMITIATNMAGRGTDIVLGRQRREADPVPRGRRGLNGDEKPGARASSCRTSGRACTTRSRRWRAAHRGHRAPREPAHRQPAARPLRPPGRPGRQPLLPEPGRPADAHLRGRPRARHHGPAEDARGRGHRGRHRQPQHRERAAQGRGAQLRHPQAAARVRRRRQRPAQGHLPAAQRDPGGAGAGRADRNLRRSAMTDVVRTTCRPRAWRSSGTWTRSSACCGRMAARGELKAEVDKSDSITDEDIVEKVVKAADAALRGQAGAGGREQFTPFMRMVLLQSIDSHWREHLAALDYLRQGIHLRGYAQKNPKQEYKREAFELFSQLLDVVKLEVTRILMTVRIQSQEQVSQAARGDRAAGQPAVQRHLHPPQRGRQCRRRPTRPPRAAEVPKVGRNDPCPCGSGKKYKQCHGKLA